MTKSTRETCYCCKGRDFWRLKDLPTGKWICFLCHPPASSADQIETKTTDKPENADE